MAIRIYQSNLNIVPHPFINRPRLHLAQIPFEAGLAKKRLKKILYSEKLLGPNSFIIDLLITIVSNHELGFIPSPEGKEFNLKLSAQLSLPTV